MNQTPNPASHRFRATGVLTKRLLPQTHTASPLAPSSLLLACTVFPFPPLLVEGGDHACVGSTGVDGVHCIHTSHFIITPFIWIYLSCSKVFHLLISLHLFYTLPFFSPLLSCSDPLPLPCSSLFFLFCLIFPLPVIFLCFFYKYGNNQI